jgi:predicted PurR-regulated permease PerM
MLFAYLFYPLVWKIERRGVHRGISIFIVLLIVLFMAGSASIFVSIKLSNTAVNFTEIKTQLDSKIDAIKNILENKIGINGPTFYHYAKQATDNIVESWQSQLGSAFASTTTVIFQIAVLPVFIFFLLFYRTKMASFIFRLVGREKKPLALHILREISTVSAKYLGGLSIVVAILAVLNSLGLYIIGIKYALVFGVLAALLNLIPYLGTFLGGSIPFAYVFFTVQNPAEPMIKVAVLFMIIQFIENYLLTPNIVGNSIKMNPLAIILSLLFANMVWGVAGMLIIVPVLAILKVIMRNVDQLKPYAYLISDRGMDKYKLKLGIFKKNKKK